MTMTPRPARRTTDADASAYTVKELVLRLDAKLDAYIAQHAATHDAAERTSAEMRADPSASASGRQLIAGQVELTHDVETLRATVESHERSIQRLVGAVAIVVFFGGGALVVAALSTAGRLLGIPIP